MRVKDRYTFTVECGHKSEMTDLSSAKAFLDWLDAELDALPGERLSDRAASLAATGSSDTIRSIRRNLASGKQHGVSTETLRKFEAFLGKERGSTSKPTARIIRPAGPEASDVEKVGEGWPDLGDEWMDVRGVTVGGDDTFFYFGDVIDQVRRPPGIRNAKNVAALNVAGESMVPRFNTGELIYVQQRMPAPGDDVVVELYPENEGDPGKSFLKQMVKKTGLRLYCKQHNPPADIEFDMGEVKAIWRVLTLRDLLG